MTFVLFGNLSHYGSKPHFRRSRPNLTGVEDKYTVKMQDPNEDTEWNDVLRAKGIIPEKMPEKEMTEDDIVNLLEHTIEKRTTGKGYDEMDLNELNELEDDIDDDEERAFEAYRRQRMAEMQQQVKKSCYGDVKEITKADYVTEVNKAGDGIWVILHVYKPGIPLCTLLNQYMLNLARKFPQTKFLRSESSMCIPNYPDKNLPTFFIYFEGEMKTQWIGPLMFGGMNLKQDELEWKLSQVGAVQTTLEECPKPEVRDVMATSIRGQNNDDSDDDY